MMLLFFHDMPLATPMMLVVFCCHVFYFRRRAHISLMPPYAFAIISFFITPLFFFFI